MHSASTVRNIGIFAHVDAGKTTLTEQSLFATKAINVVGRVDSGTSVTDSMEVERERGISVRAAAVAAEWAGCEIRLIDTPGHADFYPEVERAMSALDGAVLVLSAVEGVQHQTRIIWRALRKQGLPVLVLINKIDRAGADPDKVIAAIGQQFETLPLPLQERHETKGKPGQPTWLAETQAGRRTLIEGLADHDDALLERFTFGQDAEPAELDRAIRRQTMAGQVCPLLFGSAIGGIGVGQLLDAVVRYLPPPAGQADEPLSAVVFKVNHDSTQGREVFVRVFGGAIGLQEALPNPATTAIEKPNRILKLVPGRGMIPTERITAGDIGILRGLKAAKVGHQFGEAGQGRRLAHAYEPLLTAQITPEQPRDMARLLDALRVLEDEEPLLAVEWIDAVRQINLRFFGEIQMQIVLDQLQRRFNLNASFSAPQVVHKETPSRTAQARVERVLPNYQAYAKIELRIEPLPQGSGIRFENRVRADLIYHKFVKQIPELIDMARQSGPRGWEVIDFKAILVDAHSKYDLGTKHDDFKIVTPEVLALALEEAGTDLLEPCLEFELDTPEGFASAAFRQLCAMRAGVADQTSAQGRTRLTGRIPFVEVLGQMNALHAACHGQGSFDSRPCGYWPVSNAGGILQ